MNATYPQILKVAYPIIIGSAIQTLISVTDTAFMGRVGEVELAAIGFISVFYLILFMTAYAFTKGTQILVARRIGSGDLLDVGRIFDHSLVLVLAIATVMFIGIHGFGQWLLDVMIENKTVSVACLEYLHMRSFGTLFGFAGAVFLAFYMGINKMPVILLSITSMTIVNVFFNWVFIFGHLGIPAMGIRGAALASNMAEVVATLIFLGHMILTGTRQKYGMLMARTLTWDTFQSLFRLSLPIVMQTLIGLFSWMLFFTLVEKMGTEELAISNVVKSLYMFFGIPAWGFSAAANTVISQLMGQGKPAEVSIAIRRIIWLSLLFIVLLTLPLLVFPSLFMRLITDDFELIEKGIPVVYVCVLALWVYSVSTIMFHGIVSTGSTRYSLYIEVVAIFLYTAFLFWLYSVSWRTLPWIWVSEVFYWFITGVLCFAYLRTGHWKNIKI